MTKRKDAPTGLPPGTRRFFRLARSRPPVEQDASSEIAFHLEMTVADLIARGWTPEAARAEARRRFGDTQRWSMAMTAEDRERMADDRRTEWMDDLTQDLKYGVRSALRAPVFTLLAVLTLALGIGANAAVFGVVKSVLLNALPYPDADRLMIISTPVPGEPPGTGGNVSAGTTSDLAERQHSFEKFGAWTSPRDVIYSGTDRAEVLKVSWAQGDFFRTLHVSPLMGRVFMPDDEVHDTSLVVILPYHTWQRQFGGDRGVLGKEIRINGITRTVIGVMPQSFVPPGEDPDFWFVLALPAYMKDPIGVRGSHNFRLVGRLKSGVGFDQARKELKSIGAELEKLYPVDNKGFGMMAVPIREALSGDTRTPLLVLLASAGLVLLITCANLAGALLSRTITRRKEFAVRVAIGAGRWRLVRQLLTESTILAIAGGVVGVAIAEVGLHALRGLALTNLPTYADLRLDPGALAVTFVLALATGILFGMGPALSVARANPQGTLREESRGASESLRSRRVRGLLVAGQIALCLSLLAGAGLLARSLWEMTVSPLGFEPKHLLTFTVPMPRAATIPQRVQFHDALEQRLRGLPGVTSVASAAALPTMVNNHNGMFIEHGPWSEGDAPPFILTNRVSETFFQATGTPLIAGRVFTAADRDSSPPVAIASQALAKKYWPKGDAVGAHIHLGPPVPNAPWITIVGVVGDVRNDPARPDAEPEVFLSNRQQPFGDTYMVRTTGDPNALVSAARREAAALDPSLPFHKPATMESLLDERFTPQRLPVALMTSFGLLALIVASVGIYAMFAAMTAAREREFGVRIALGSSPAQIASLVVRQGGVWMLLGLIGGAAGVVVVSKLVRGLLYQVAPFDPMVLAGTVVILVACALVALLSPVRRATRADPISALR